LRLHHGKKKYFPWFRWLRGLSSTVLGKSTASLKSHEDNLPVKEWRFSAA
jgi:hypothetical protein